MYMFGDGGLHIGWMLLWWLVPVALIVAAIWLGLGRSGPKGTGEPPSPEQVLKRRYAAGEIDRETYERMLDDLRK